MGNGDVQNNQQPNANEQVNKFKGFVNKAIANLSNLVRLEVNTLVGDYKFRNVEGILTTIEQDSTKERMTSQINLLTGDITTAMTEKFVNEYKDLREYHLVRETQGHQIIDKNINTIKEIVKALEDLLEKNKKLSGDE